MKAKKCLECRLTFFVLLFLSASFLATFVQSEKILFLLPIATKSHKNVVDPLIFALAGKNHSVTVVSPITPSKLRHSDTNSEKSDSESETSGSTEYKRRKPINPRIRDIVPVTQEKIWKEFNPFEQRKAGKFAGFFQKPSIFDLISQACDDIYKSEEFMSLLQEADFDLIFFSAMFNTCFDGFVHRLKAPLIFFAPQTLPLMNTEAMGLHLPPSFVPLTLTGFSDRMDFKQRVINFVATHLFGLFGKFIFLSRFEENGRKNLGGEIPSSGVLQRNASAVFMNSHFALTYPRPLLPDTIEVGGMHCSPSKPLPADLEKFVSGGKDGFILFSLGSVVQTDLLPDEIRIAFLNVFAGLKQRVIWKWNSGQMDGLPQNVMVSKWLPQQDILGHSNIRAFITHGGLLSTQEATYFGVPLIGIPLFADQDINMKQAERSGYALTVEVLDDNFEESLRTAINRILNEKQFSERAKELSTLFRDQPETPLERAVFWSEYIMRHKGAVHLRSAARDLNSIQYHSIDVLAFLTLILVIWASITFYLTKMCCRKICGKKRTNDSKKRL